MDLISDIRPVPSNPFSAAIAAELYHRGRPYHHGRALERIREIVGAGRPTRALDVACGTGLSTLALSGLAEAVIGIDTVPEMLTLAPRRPGIEYQLAPAEQLPFAGASFDALTVSSGLHWFDQPAFYREARRVLRPGAWIAIYDHYFMGEILGQTAFSDWFERQYLQHFPTPPRGAKFDPGGELLRGFVHLGDDNYEDPISMTQEGLVNYLMTQSNCIAALETRRVDVEGLRRQLVGETQQFFPTAATSAVLRFYGKINCLSASSD